MDYVRPNPTLDSIIKDGNYDLVILPASGYAVEGIDIAWICEENNNKSLFLIDNWLLPFASIRPCNRRGA